MKTNNFFKKLEKKNGGKEDDSPFFVHEQWPPLGGEKSPTTIEGGFRGGQNTP